MMQNNKLSVLVAFLVVFLCAINNNSLTLAFSLIAVSSSSSRQSRRSPSSTASSPSRARASSSNNNDVQDDRADLHQSDNMISLFKGILLSSRSHDSSRSIGRRQAVLSALRPLLFFAACATSTSIGACRPQVANAKDYSGPPSSADEAFARVQFELQDKQDGSMALLQAALTAQDFAQLLTLSRDMDQSLRKKVLNSAKSFIVKEQAEAATLICNAVTFDLIGINRNSRPGQENASAVQKYIDELRDDMSRMLTLQRL